MNNHFKTVNPIYIGFSGYKQSGKDTSAALIFRHLVYAEFYHLPESFAYGVYEEVAKQFGVTIPHLKEIKTNPFVRHMLQFAGTECGRDVHGINVWVDKLKDRVDKAISAADKARRAIVFVTDVRFSNEAQFIKDNHGCIIRVERHGQILNDTHRSETEIDSLPRDWTLINWRMGDLERECKFIAQHIKERYGIGG